MKKRIYKTICIALVAVLCMCSLNAQNKNSSEGWVLSWCAPTAYDFLGSSKPVGNTATINISNLNNGVYFVRVGFEGGGSVKKLVKQ